jgi:hypothetical protein
MCKLFLDLKIIIQLIFVGLGFGLKFQNLSQKQDFLFSSLFPKFLGISVAPAFEGGFGAFGTCFQISNLSDWSFQNFLKIKL